MSMCEIKNIRCERCGTMMSFTVWKTLNSKQNPKETQEMLNDQLFKSICPNCHSEWTIVYPMLYQDAESLVWIQLVSREQEDEYRQTYLDFIRQSNFMPKHFRIVHTVEDLREKANIFKVGLDDRIIELMKVHEIGVEKRRWNGKCITKARFILLNNGKLPIFEFFNDTEVLFHKPIDSALYKKLTMDYGISVFYLIDVIDSNWADGVIAAGPKKMREWNDYLVQQYQRLAQKPKGYNLGYRLGHSLGKLFSK